MLNTISSVTSMSSAQNRFDKYVSFEKFVSRINPNKDVKEFTLGNDVDVDRKAVDVIVIIVRFNDDISKFENNFLFALYMKQISVDKRVIFLFKNTVAGIQNAEYEDAIDEIWNSKVVDFLGYADKVGIELNYEPNPIGLGFELKSLSDF